MSKRLVMVLFFYQFVFSLFLYLILILFNLLQYQLTGQVKSNAGLGFIFSLFFLLGVGIGTYLFARRQERKQPNLLEGILKKLSFYVALIQSVVTTSMAILFNPSIVMPPNQPVPLVVVVIIGSFIISFIIYYYLTQVWANRGIKKEKELKEAKLVS